MSYHFRVRQRINKFKSAKLLVTVNNLPCDSASREQVRIKKYELDPVPIRSVTGQNVRGGD